MDNTVSLRFCQLKLNNKLRTKSDLLFEIGVKVQILLQKSSF